MRQYYCYHWPNGEHQDKLDSLLEKCAHHVSVILPYNLDSFNDLDRKMEAIMKNDQRLIGIVMYMNRYIVSGDPYTIVYEAAFSDENSAILFKMLAS